MPLDPNMGFTNPEPTQTDGPEYATDVSDALTTVGKHDHTPGGSNGVPVPTAGINIDADFPLNGFNATIIKALRFLSQANSLTGPSDLLEAYVKGGELTYRDGLGNETQITKNGAVNVASASGIGGDYGGGNPALVSYDTTNVIYNFESNSSGPAYAAGRFAGIENQGNLRLFSTAVSSSPYTIAANDLVLLVDPTASTIELDLPDPTTFKRFIIVKDATGQSGTHAITLKRHGSETIDGVASDKTLSKAYGIWYILSNGTNWFILKDDVAQTDKTSVTVFEGSRTAGTDTLTNAHGTTWVSPTLAAPTLSEGTAVTRSTNTLTFPFTGKYSLELWINGIGGGAPGTGTGLFFSRVENTSDTTVADQFQVTANSYTRFDFNVADVSKGYQLQFNIDKSAGNVTLSSGSAPTEGNGATSPRWKFRITKLKDI